MLILLSAVQGGETDRLQTLDPLQYSDPLYIIYKFSQTFNLDWGPAGGEGVEQHSESLPAGGQSVGYWSELGRTASW